MNIVINLNKDRGISSHDAVASVKRIFKVRKAGHAGTLDPLATGILLVCINEATKIARFLSDLDKEYVVTAKLGESTDTFDAEGTITQRTPHFRLTENQIGEVIKRFVGEIDQVPPMHSAIKISGRPLYKLARKGIEIPRSPRRVVISSIELLHFEEPFITLRVACSKGTYIRSLCNDIGDLLGTGAHVTRLVRTRIGHFSLETSAKIEELPHKAGSLHSLDAVLSYMPEIVLSEEEFALAKNGNPFPSWTGRATNHFLRLRAPGGELFGIGRADRNSIRIERLLRL